MQNIKVLTWNINSVRKRLGLLEKIINDASPDVIALQETKVKDELFPQDFFYQLGYEFLEYRGEPGYNGVCIASKLPVKRVKNIEFIKDARHIAVDYNGVEIHNFYVPAGGDIPDPDENPKFKHKLDFLDGVTNWAKNKPNKFIVLGDLNIAPLEQDVWSHKQLLKVVSHTPIEVEKMMKWFSTLGAVDAARHFVGNTEKLYSWWSYRNRDWKKSNRGRRLDHVWISRNLVDNLLSSSILKHYRDEELPSDHVPIIIDIAL